MFTTSEQILGTPATSGMLATTGRFARARGAAVTAVVQALREADAALSADPKRGYEIYVSYEPSKLPPELLIKMIAGDALGHRTAGRDAAIGAFLLRQQEAEVAGDLAEVAAIMARLWSDSSLAHEGRGDGPGALVFLEMSGTALPRAGGRSLDSAPAFERLAEIVGQVISRLPTGSDQEVSRWWISLKKACLDFC